MKRFIAKLNTGTRWLCGIGIWIVYVASGALPHPLNQIIGFILAIVLGAYIFACTVWEHTSDADEISSPRRKSFSLRWSHLLILMLTIALASSALELREDELTYSDDTPSQSEEGQALEPYIDDITTQLQNDFVYVDISYSGNTITARVANDGMSQSLYLVKTSSDPDNAEYREFVDGLQDFVKHTAEDLRTGGLDNIHFELQLLDDIELLNYFNFDASYPSTLLEIYDGELRYDKMTDPSPESYEQSELITQGKQQALRAALQYLRAMPFSHQGLVKQLEYEGYTYEEAVYGADNCGADWYAQAALTASNYLDTMAFSREGLIDQLEYEGFTHDEAIFGVESVGY